LPATSPSTDTAGSVRSPRVDTGTLHEVAPLPAELGAEVLAAGPEEPHLRLGWAPERTTAGGGGQATQNSLPSGSACPKATPARYHFGTVSGT
jgi:hypothetical protein